MTAEYTLTGNRNIQGFALIQAVVLFKLTQSVVFSSFETHTLVQNFVSLTIVHATSSPKNSNHPIPTYRNFSKLSNLFSNYLMTN